MAKKSSNNDINVLVGANFSPLESTLQEAAQAVKAGGEQIAAASEKATKASANSFKSLQQEYRNTFKAAQMLAQELGTDSEAFREAAAKAASFKDQLDDVQDSINAYHPEKKWKVTADAISGAAGVAQGFVGALTIIGLESANAEKAIASMMALQGIAQAAESIEMLKGAFVALSGTMQATLVGAAALVAGMVIYNAMADESAEANQRLASSFKIIEDSEKKVLNIVSETQDLRIRAMKDGYAKSLATINQAEKKELATLVESRENGLIAEMTYQTRKTLLFKHYANERDKLAKEEAEKAKKSSIDFDPQAMANMRERLDLFKQNYTVLKDMSALPSQADPNSADGLIETTNAYKQLADSIGYASTKHEEFLAKQQLVSESLANLKNNLISVAFSAAGSFAESIGAAAAGAETLGKDALAIIGSLASQIGNQLLAMAAIMFVVPGMKGMALAYAAGGVGLKILGGALGQASSGKGASKPSTSMSTANYGSDPIGGSNFGGTYFTMNGRVRGQDLVIATSNTNRDNRR